MRGLYKLHLVDKWLIHTDYKNYMEGNFSADKYFVRKFVCKLENRHQDDYKKVILHHGSSVGYIKKLKSFVSEHGKPYVYLVSNPIVNLFCAAKLAPKPVDFYS